MNFFYNTHQTTPNKFCFKSFFNSFFYLKMSCHFHRLLPFPLRIFLFYILKILCNNLTQILRWLNSLIQYISTDAQNLIFNTFYMHLNWKTKNNYFIFCYFYEQLFLYSNSHRKLEDFLRIFWLSRGTNWSALWKWHFVRSK